MVTLQLCIDLISLKIACDSVMNAVHYSKIVSSVSVEVKCHQRVLTRDVERNVEHSRQTRDILENKDDIVPHGDVCDICSTV